MELDGLGLDKIFCGIVSAGEEAYPSVEVAEESLIAASERPGGQTVSEESVWRLTEDDYLHDTS